MPTNRIMRATAELALPRSAAIPRTPAITYVTTGRGTNVAPRWSPDDKRLVYQHTDTQNSADLFVADATAGAKPARLTNSMPAGIDHSAFVEPQFVHLSRPGW